MRKPASYPAPLLRWPKVRDDVPALPSKLRWSPDTAHNYLIIASLMVLPWSVFVAYQMWPFPSLFLQRICFFALPALLVAAKVATCPRVRQTRFRPLSKYFAYVAYGLLASQLFASRAGWENIQHYVQLLYWMMLSGVYVAVTDRPASYHLNLIRVLFTHVPYYAFVFAAVYLFTPYRPALLTIVNSPLSMTLGNLDFSPSPWFNETLPRFSFFCIEPRVAGTMMTLGLFLQMGHLIALRRSGLRIRRPVVELAMMGGALLLIFSHLAFLGLVAAILCGLVIWVVRSESGVWSSLLLGGALIVVAATLYVDMTTSALSGVYLQTESSQASQQIGEFLAAYGGKTGAEDTLHAYFDTWLDGMPHLVSNPLGRGVRYYRLGAEDPADFEASNNSLKNVYIHAGIIGLFCAAWLARHLVTTLRISARRNNLMVLWACRFALFAMVFSLAIDSISLTTWYYFLLFLIERGRRDSVRQPSLRWSSL
ncbi:MAG TPA: hypothetical protein VEV17_05735 [Bryobacteraceae bacterium]|nr:hypothetical protein [Bryobacteraceae bacterium]